LHAGFTHHDIASHSERLVIIGGCEAHIPIFSSSDELVPMRGYALDLRTFTLMPQNQNNAKLPPARLRLASEKMGEWLILYGGHGEGDRIGERTQLHKLNLRTLKWGALDLQGKEGGHPAAPAATMSAGLVLGGVKFTMFGISTVQKLDVLTLCIGGTSSSAAAEGDEPSSPAEESSSEDDDEDPAEQVTVVMRSPDGTARRVVLPRAMLGLLMASQRAAGGRRSATGGDNDDDDAPDAD